MILDAYHTPATREEAFTLLRELGERGLPVAGATSHVFLKEQETKTAVDLSRIGISGICPDGDGWIIGAMSSIDDIDRMHEPGWVLDRVADRFVTRQIRNMSTLGGNICRVFPWADFPVALLVLDAEMRIEGTETRTMPAADFFKGQPARHFQPGDLLTGIRVPRVDPPAAFAYAKQTRTGADFSQMTAACVLTVAEGKIESVKLAAGGGIPMPKRLVDVEASLTGIRAGEKAVREAVEASASTVSFRSVEGFSAEYIARLGAVILGDVVIAACTASKGGAE